MNIKYDILTDCQNNSNIWYTSTAWTGRIFVKIGIAVCGDGLYCRIVASVSRTTIFTTADPERRAASSSERFYWLVQSRRGKRSSLRAVSAILAIWVNSYDSSSKHIVLLFRRIIFMESIHGCRCRLTFKAINYVLLAIQGFILFC